MGTKESLFSSLKQPTGKKKILAESHWRKMQELSHNWGPPKQSHLHRLSSLSNMTKKLIQYWTHFLLPSLLKICWRENDTKRMVKEDGTEQKFTIISDLLQLSAQLPHKHCRALTMLRLFPWTPPAFQPWETLILFPAEKPHAPE